MMAVVVGSPKGLHFVAREAPVNGTNTTANRHNGRYRCRSLDAIQENDTTQKAQYPGVIQSIQNTQECCDDGKDCKKQV